MPAERAYSYAVPAGMTVEPGSIVRVPLGPREVAGIVWDGDTDAIDPRKLRPILHAFDCPPIGQETRRFVDWVAAYTLTPPGLVARMLLRAPEAFDPEPWIEGLRRTAAEPDRITEARRRVLELAAARHGLDAVWPGARGGRVGGRCRRPEGAGRVRAGDDPAAQRRRGAGPCLRADVVDGRSGRRGGAPCGRRSTAAASASPCSTG